MYDGEKLTLPYAEDIGGSLFWKENGEQRAISGSRIKEVTYESEEYHALYGSNKVTETKIINSKNQVLYIYTYDMTSGKYGNNYLDTDNEYLGYVLAITKDGLEYRHEKTFHSYEKIKEFALKIKDNGVINLEFWKCLGDYDWENDAHEELEEDYYDDGSEDRANQDVLDMIEADRLPDNTVPGFRD